MSVLEVSGEESDRLKIMPLGAGQEVGRSCILLTFKGKKIILDCGIHPGLRHKDSLPFIDAIPDIQNTDLILISHFHLDHCGGLPYLLLKSGAKAKCYMTHATKAIYRYLLADFVRVSQNSSATASAGMSGAGTASSSTSDQSLYTDAEIITSLSAIDTLDFHQECEVNGIKFTAFHAGHVLGAAMFLIEIAGVKVLYTGDFSRQEDRHLMCAEVPPVRPDVLITEATYGIHIHDKREEREFRFTSIVHDIVRRGGRCLIPAFALGRAQELMLILDEYWAAHPELHDIPIYYASQLARKCMAVYQTYIHAMNERIRSQLANNNPFVFRHISSLKSIEHFADSGPCVVMASPGMMQSGLSRELFENWCTDTRNGVIIAGYCVEGTLAKMILSQPQEVPTMSGQTLPLKCSVNYISFSAHTDYQQTSEFIRELQPRHVVLVHGEQNEMSRLCSALQREYEDGAGGDAGVDEEAKPQQIDFHMPKNCQEVDLRFRGEKIAKVLGSLARAPPKHDTAISGVLVKRNFAYHLMVPAELPTYTEMASTVVMQHLTIPYKGSVTTLKFYLLLLAGDVETVAERPASVEYRLFDCVSVTWRMDQVTLRWQSDPTNDMCADAIMTTLLRSSLQHRALHPDAYPIRQFSQEMFREALLQTFSDAFGPECLSMPANFAKAGYKPLEDTGAPGSPVNLYIDNHMVAFNFNTITAHCEDNAKLANIVQTLAHRLYVSLAPV